jgi:uncharacterized RDD family membrane protein YckC
MQDESPNAYAKQQVLKVRDAELASLGVRFLGFIIDWGILIIVFAILAFLSGRISIADIAKPPPPDLHKVFDLQKFITENLMGALLWMFIQGYFLYTSGQTIGKKILGTRIVTMENEKPNFIKLMIMRCGLMGFIGGIPLAIIADAIFIFIGADRRCLHDHIAGTKVIVDSQDAV